MAKFADKTGAEWELEITFGSATRLKKAGFDLDTVKDESGQSLVKAIYSGPEVLAEVIWVLVREQVEKQGLTREAFEDRLTWREADKAADALWEAVLDFIHRRRSPAVKERLPEMLRMIDQASDKAARAIDLQSVLNSSGGSVPASSASPTSTT